MNNITKKGLDIAYDDFPSYSRIMGEERAKKYMGAIKGQLALMSEQQYLKIKSDLLIMATAGLMPMKGRSIFHIIKYGNEYTIQLGYQAFVELSARSGILINAQAVCKTDTFEINIATSEIKHSPSNERNELNQEEVVGVYATCLFKGQRLAEYMNSFELASHRDKFSKQKGPQSVWGKHFVEMAKKTVIIKLCKRLPMISEPLQDIINIENNNNVDLKKEEKVVDVEKINKAVEQFSPEPLIAQQQEELDMMLAKDVPLFEEVKEKAGAYYGND